MKSAEGEVEGKERAPSILQATSEVAREEHADLACDVIAFKAKAQQCDIRSLHCLKFPVRLVLFECTHATLVSSEIVLF